MDYRSLPKAWGGALILASGLAAPAMAAEVAEGTLLDKSNIDELMDQTLDGHKISDLLAGQMENMIRNYGHRMELIKSSPVTQDPTLLELTEKHKGEATLDEKGRLQNYTTGAPFPEISPDDPQGGIKVTYNILRFGWLGDAIDLNPIYFMIVDGEKGLEREQGWHYKRFIMSGRTQEPYVLNKELTKYEGLIAKYPNDIQGLGLLTVNYADGRLPDVYVYIKAFRRVRRLSSSVWADPVQATDILFDETFGLNLDPTWYDAWNLKGKRMALGTAHGDIKTVKDAERDPKKKYPAMDFDNPPYWNYRENAEPREVWHLEAVPPGNHLVSKRDMFVSTVPTAPMMFWQDLYDRKGEFWRAFAVHYNERPWKNTQKGTAVSAVAFWDVQRMHATVFHGSEKWFFNDPGAKAVDYSPEALPRFID